MSIAIKGRGFLVARPVAALVLLLSLTACSLPVFFRVPIVQGNIVTAAQVNKLKIGMTKKQVAYVLGTPLIKAPFQSDRWDYVFYYRNPRAHVRQSELNLFFTDGHLDHISGDDEYQAAVAKFGQQTAPSEDEPLPGAVSAPGAPLGVEPGTDNTGNGVPGNASQSIPHTDTSRPSADNVPARGPLPANAPTRPTGVGAGNSGALPPLPGKPGI